MSDITKKHSPEVQEQLAKAKARKSQAKPAKVEPKTYTRGEAASRPTDADTLASKIRRNAQEQAKKDAQKVLNYGRQVYAVELERELTTLLGGSDMRSFFRAESEGWSLPDAANTQQLAGTTIDALPSAD